MASTKIAIAGGSGGLGRALVEALKQHGGFEVFVLARKSDNALAAAFGVPVLQAEYADKDALVQLLEQRGIDTVVSTIAGLDSTPEVNLVAAAEESRVTRRFVPSVWSGFDYTREEGKQSPTAAAKLVLTDALAATHLEHTSVYPGIFLDYYTLNGDLASHIPRTAFALDVQANAAAIPGAGDYPVYLTHSRDIAAYTARLLALPTRWAPKYWLHGAVKTWNEMVAIAEKAKGVKFEVTYDGVETLKSGGMTELPGHSLLYEAFGGVAAKPVFQQMVSLLSAWMAEGRLREGTPLLNDLFPDVRTVTVEEAMRV